MILDAARGVGDRRVALTLTALAALVLSAAFTMAKADCRYGTSSEPENTEVKRADTQLYLCIAGRWLRVSDIPAVIKIEQANLWSACCGSADETDGAKAACDGRRRCAVSTGGGVAASEPQQRRHLRVRYHCEKGPKDLPTSHFAGQAEENAPLKLSCEAFNFDAFNFR